MRRRNRSVSVQIGERDRSRTGGKAGGVKKGMVGIMAATMVVALTAGTLLGLPAKTDTAEAARGTGWVTVGELYDDEKGCFDASNVLALYRTLVGSKADTLGLGVFEEAKVDADTRMFRSKNNGNSNVSVTFGGIKWDAVFVTSAKHDGENTKQGDVILDLWQSADKVTQTSKWAERSDKGNSPEDDYPANMYSTSYIRVVTLNAGGYYSTSGSTLSAYNPQSNLNPYARFTMEGKDSSGKDSLIAYLAKPSEVGYQETEFCEPVTANKMSGHYTPNDAYGEPREGAAWEDSKFNYSGKGSTDGHVETNYDAWKDDYLWLPSITEAGCAGGTSNADSEANGLWRTNEPLRSANDSNGTWFRTGDDDWSFSGYYLDTDGGHVLANVNDLHGVRPAIHLNLSAINATIAGTIQAEWEPSKQFYTTGEDITADITADITNNIRFTNTADGSTIARDKVTFSVSTDSKSITSSGTYTFTVQLGAPQYQFSRSGRMKATFQVEVGEAVASVTADGKTTSYGTFDSAMRAAEEAEKKAGESDVSANIILKLFQDATHKGTILGGSTVDFTFDLNGCTVTMTNPLHFATRFTATLTDTSGKGTGKFEGDIYVDYSQFTLQDGVTLNGGVTVNDGEFIMNGGTITNSKGYSMTVNKGKFTMNGGSITSNTAPDGGGVYAAEGSTFTMTGGTITNGNLHGEGVTLEKGTVFEWGGGSVDTVMLAKESKIKVLRSYTEPSGSKKIIVKADPYETAGGPFQAIDWTAIDSSETVPLKYFENEKQYTCLYEDAGNKVAYIGQHVVEIDKIKWADDCSSVTFEAHCQHCDYAGPRELTESAGKITSSTTKAPTCTQSGTERNTARADLRDLSPFDVQNATLASGADFTMTQDKTLDPTGHAWKYTSDETGITATCEHEHTAADGDRTFTVTLSASDTTYDSESHPAEAALTAGQGAFPGGYSLSYTYNKDKAEDYEALSGSPKNAGYYLATLTATEGAVSVSKKFKIEQATLTVTLSAEKRTYNGGTDVNVTCTVTDGRYGDDEVSVSVVARFESPDVGEEKTILIDAVSLSGAAAGNYTVDRGALAVKGEVEQKKIAISWKGVEGLVFNGKEQAPVPTLPEEGIPDVDGNEERLFVSAEVPGEHRNAGGYTATAVLGGTAAGNYAIESGERQAFTIGQASIVVRLTSGVRYTASQEYNGDPFEVSGERIREKLTFTYPSGVSDGELTELEVQGISTGAADASSYSGTVSITYNTTNFTLEGEIPYTLTVTPKLLRAGDVNWSVEGVEKGKLLLEGDKLSFVYDGREHSPVATIEGVKGSTLTLVVTANGEETFKTVGTYTLVAVLDGGETNYTFGGAGLSREAEIKKAELTLKWTEQTSYEYGSTEGIIPTASIASGIQGEDEGSLTLSVSEDDGKTFRNAGTYSYTATLGGDAAGNYDISNPVNQYVITKAKLEANLSGTVVFGDELDVRVEIASGIKNSDDGAALAEEAKKLVNKFETSYEAGKTAAGTAGVTVRCGETVTLANYTVTFREGTVTVQKRQIGITPQGTLSHIYGEALGDISSTAEREGAPSEKWFGNADDEALLASSLVYTFKRAGDSIPKGYTPDMGAGDYVICVAWSGESPLKTNYEIVNMETGVSYTVHKAALTVTAKPQTLVYGDAPSSANEDVTFAGFANGETEDVIRGEVKFSFGYERFGNVGSGFSITLDVSELEADNYTFEVAPSGHGTITVNRKNISVTITVPKDITYGAIGTFRAAFGEGDIVNGDDVQPLLSFSGTAYNGTSFHDAPMAELTLAGDYSVKVTLGGTGRENYLLRETGASAAFSIAKATASRPAADPTVFVYNGREQTYNVVGGDIERFSVDGAAQTDANEEGYIVTVSLDDPFNFMWEDTKDTDDLEFRFVIKRAPLTVTAKDRGITYGDAPSNGGVAYEGFVGEEGVSDLAGALAFGYGTYKPYEDVGTYPITPSGLSSANYRIEFRDGTLTVSPKEIAAVWYEKSYTYTGSAFTELPEATAEGIGEDGTFTLIVALNDSTLVFRNAGEYLFKAELDGTNRKAKNYTLLESSALCRYTVSKKPVAAPGIPSKVYSGSVQTAEIDVTGKDYGVQRNEGGIDVGTYEVVLRLNDTANFMWQDTGRSEDKRLEFSITKATYDMGGVRFANVTLYYDASEHSIGIEGDLPQGVQVRYEGNGQREAGEYTVTAIFTGDERNYEPIPSKQARLIILAVSHDLSGISFEDVTVKYDEREHSILIEGTLPTNVTVSYEGNGRTEPGIYTVTAVFSDPDAVFERRTAALTILRTQTQTAPQAEPSPGEESKTDVFLVSEEGFDPTLELIVEKIEGIDRKYLAWQRDEISETYAVKLCRDGEEVPIDGKVTVRLLIPEAFREKDFELMAVARGVGIEYERDGDYVIFEADGLSAYVFTSAYVPYFPVVIFATGVLLADVAVLIALAVVTGKKRRKVR